MKVAVVGAGLFGCTAAIYAARAGHEVQLYEQRSGVMQGASGRSYYRLHRGFHYPRSPDTGLESTRAEIAFKTEFGPAVINSGTQLYAIADGGKTEGEEFSIFVRYHNLPSERLESHPLITGSDWIFKVREPRIDSYVLTRMVDDALHGMVKLNILESCPEDVCSRFDQVIVAGYDGTNAILEMLGLEQQRYKFQVVEKPIVRMPLEFRRVGQEISIVVLDGPFGCLDPHGSTDMHVLGHVVETIHHSNVGCAPEVPEHLAPWLYRAPDVFPDTRFSRVVEDMARFIPDVRKAEYMGSSLTMRAVLADVEDTDARPTLVERLNDKVIRVFSGKMGTAVVAAKQVVGMLEHEKVLEVA